MEPLRRVRQLWNWLPAFRAVAETEHLPTAAEKLHVSPSALSRAVKLLEEDLGVDLFARRGRQLVLTDEGARFLARVRVAMQTMHEGLEDLTADPMDGVLRVSSGGMATLPYVLPTVLGLQRAHPQLRVRLGTLAPARVADALLAEELDLAVQSVPLAHPGVRVRLLGQARNGLYVGPGHPLFDQERVTLDDVLAHDFTAPPADEHGRTWEGWPSHLVRRVRLELGTMQLGVEACAEGIAVAVLPDGIARRRGTLRRLPLDLIPSTPILAVTRLPLGHPTRADRALEALQATLADEVGQDLDPPPAGP